MVGSAAPGVHGKQPMTARRNWFSDHFAFALSLGLAAVFFSTGLLIRLDLSGRLAGNEKNERKIDPTHSSRARRPQPLRADSGRAELAVAESLRLR